jgi:hypothetical protein
LTSRENGSESWPEVQELLTFSKYGLQPAMPLNIATIYNTSTNSQNDLYSLSMQFIYINKIGVNNDPVRSVLHI